MNYYVMIVTALLPVLEIVGEIYNAALEFILGESCELAAGSGAVERGLAFTSTLGILLFCLKVKIWKKQDKKLVAGTFAVMALNILFGVFLCYKAWVTGADVGAELLKSVMYPLTSLILCAFMYQLKGHNLFSFVILVIIIWANYFATEAFGERVVAAAVCFFCAGVLGIAILLVAGQELVRWSKKNAGKMEEAVGRFADAAVYVILYVMVWCRVCIVAVLDMVAAVALKASAAVLKLMASAADSWMELTMSVLGVGILQARSAGLENAEEFYLALYVTVLLFRLCRYDGKERKEELWDIFKDIRKEMCLMVLLGGVTTGHQWRQVLSSAEAVEVLFLPCISLTFGLLYVLARSVCRQMAAPVLFLAVWAECICSLLLGSEVATQIVLWVEGVSVVIALCACVWVIASEHSRKYVRC